ncbi:MAG: HalOD1 output domain-containing protein [Haloplanus sp.]
MPSQRTVLHVDDDPDVLDLSSDWASVRDGVTWLTATDPDTGLELLSSRDVDCLVSDSFRTADGQPFVTYAADARPDLPVVLFSSKHRDDVDPEIRESSVYYVKKGSSEPFQTLFDRVLELVGTSPTDDAPLAVDVAPRAGTRADGSDTTETTERWVPIARFRPGDRDDLSTVIVSAVEEHTGRDATEFPPLYDSIDADALAALCRRPDGRPRDGVQVRFHYAGHELAVTGEGLVLVRSD